MSAIASASGIVLTRKYEKAIAISGTAMATSRASTLPPSARKTWPAASTVMTSIAMLKSVRNGGLRFRAFSVDWLQPLAAPTIIAACGPHRRIDAMSTTYDTDMFEPPVIGNCTLNAAVRTESSARNANDRTGVSVARGTSVTKRSAPSATTAMMYQRPRGGRSRSKTCQVYFCPDEICSTGTRPSVQGPAARVNGRTIRLGLDRMRWSAQRGEQLVDRRLGAANALKEP